ncbi:MAG: DUF1553 domain-containing protein [Planctomycetes bacterium]|nr:DUF1553 domain-containing protein [Planctomycetota bacterium]
MQGIRKFSLGAVALAILAFSGPSSAQLYEKKPAKSETIAMPTPAEVQSLEAQPKTVTLKGLDDSAQLVVTAQLANRIQDLSGDVKYEIANPSVARITSAGRIMPLSNGTTEITASYGDKPVKVALKIESCDVNLPINFTNHIVPIFTKLGCNSGGCHGKSGGQNGFALSLLGFVPELDYQTLVKENRGRRLFPASPDNSLLLLKATGTVAHAGGRRMEVGSDEFKLVRRWIASGTPFGDAKDPVVTKITVSPDHRILTRSNRQQFAVHAHYSDGSVQDVTQRAQFESNDTEIAMVDGAALVRTLELSGEAAVMARYQGQVAVFRATVPLGMKTPDYKFEPKTVVDRSTHKKWQELGVVPSDLCSDEQFIRRVSLDITGTLPTPDQVKKFLADSDPQKRDKLVDHLLETPEYTYLFANKWADILRVKRRNEPGRAQGTFAFHAWIREAIAKDLPYDQFARSILAASGEEHQTPPTVWYKELQNPEQFVDDTAQVFLGLRMACAQCHHHPYEKWSQDDYWGLAAFFGRVGRKNMPTPGGIAGQQFQSMVIFNRSSGAVTNKRTGQPAKITPLDGAPMDVSAEDDPRHKLVDWMADTKNPFFARAVANRYWAHFFGRGIVDPLDDMRITNPPSNPELLDALAKELVDSKYSLKHLIKVIVKSRTYQLSAIPNDFNKHDKQAYARFYPRRMGAEILFDAVSQVTNAPASFGGLPQDKHAPNRAIMLPDEAFSSYFLDVFGRPQRISACECERVSEANLAQALHLLNSQEIQDKLARANGRADLLAKDARPDAQKVEELFLWAFARRPSSEHLQVALSHIERNAANKKLAYENLLWALINTKEFVFNQ